MLEIGIRVGKLLMKSGAEVYRVEDTMVRFCKAYKDVENVESFVIATGIMLTIQVDGHSYSKVCRVQSRSTNLECIEDVNALSREVQTKDFTMEEVEERLDKIAQKPMYPQWMTILFGAIGAAGFAMFFEGNLYEIGYSFIIGLVIRYLTIWLNKLEMNSFINNVLLAGIVSLLSVFFHQISILARVDTLVISGIMLLIPGLAITNAIRDTMSGDYLSAGARAMEACMLACAIALGAGLVLISMRYFL
ncbi:MAG: threonine/serine exporter family protein [Bacillota bacterium]|nr:threonine/serine exporter family protein [Bacillota bacterium]